MENWEVTKIILLLGGIAGAVTGIIALAVKIATGIKHVVKYFTELREAVDTLVRHDKSQYLSILRLTVVSENMPLSERIAAGKEYIENEGNGDVKHYYETELKPYDTIHRKEENT